MQPRSRFIRYALTAAVPLVLVRACELLPTPRPSFTWPLALAYTAVLFFIGWWLVIRPAVAWNAGGVAIVGATGRHRFSWAEVTEIKFDRGRIALITTDGRRVLVPVRARLGGRSTASLRAELKRARSRYSPGIDPPPLPSSGFPLPLLMLLPLVAGLLVSNHS